VTLNAFNRHCQRVRMANIAQTINVLQAMILTDGPRMVLTPTFHVYEMYAVHQDALMLPSEVRCAEYRLGGQSIPGVSASASCDARGRIHVTLCNLHPRRDAPVTCKFEGRGVRRASGRVLTAPEMTAHNTFDAPDRVKPAPFSDLWPCDGGWLVQLPPRSVVVLEVE
jgi:alpha-N-arabinofuranosidase